MGTDDLKKYFEDKIAEIFYEAVFEKKLTDADKEFLHNCNIQVREAPSEAPAPATAVLAVQPAPRQNS